MDWWALGILIYELINGTPPFASNNPMYAAYALWPLSRSRILLHSVPTLTHESPLSVTIRFDDSLQVYV